MEQTTPSTLVAFSTTDGTGMCNASMAESATKDVIFCDLMANTGALELN